MSLGDLDTLKPQLADYLKSQTGCGWELTGFTRFAVGFSWITFGFTGTPAGGEAQQLILRLGPPYGLFAPYNAGPEYHALKLLEASDVPAPASYWWNDDEAILGAPFFICEKVAGDAPVPWGTGGSGFDEDFRNTIGRQFVSALASQHRVDCSGAEGLDAQADGLTLANAALRQVETWEANKRRWALRSYPLLDFALHWLRAHLPQAPRISLVHGDYRLGNFLVEDKRISAILDWELVHLGDPHEDLGWAFLPQFAASSGLVCQLVSEEDFISQYQKEAGFQVNRDSLDFYRIFSLLKLALTHIAAVRCFEDGRFDDMRMPAMGTQIAPVLRQIEKALDKTATQTEGP